MKVGSYIYTNSYAPADTNQLWIKPMSNGEAVLYIFVDGKWTPTGGVGESAYSAAVKEGFVGTKSEWLESLALKYSDLTPAQKAELAQPAAEQAALAAQYAETIHQAIDDLDPSQSSDDAIVAEAATRASKDSELETTLDALGPKIREVGSLMYEREIITDEGTLGYISASGVVSESTSYRYSAPVTLNRGDKVVISDGNIYLPNGWSVIAKATKVNDEYTYEKLVGGSATAHYEYVATEEIDVVVTTPSNRKHFFVYRQKDSKQMAEGVDGMYLLDVNLLSEYAIAYTSGIYKDVDIKAGSRVAYRIESESINSMSIRRVYSDGSTNVISAYKAYDIVETTAKDIVRVEIYLAAASVASAQNLKLYIYTGESLKQRIDNRYSNFAEYLSGSSQKVFSVKSNNVNDFYPDIVVPRGRSFTVSASSTAISGNISVYEINKANSSRLLSASLSTSNPVNVTATFEPSYLRIYVSAASATSDGDLTLDFTFDDSINEERIETLEEDNEDNKEAIEALQNEMSALGSDEGSSLGNALMERREINANYPYYFSTDPATLDSFSENYYDAKCRAVPKDGKQFMFITDVHWGGYSQAKVYSSISSHKSNLLLDYIRKRLGIHKVLNGGDCLDAAPNPYLAAQLLSDYAEEFYSTFSNDGIWVQGNHDANCNKIGSWGTLEELIIPDQEVYNRTVKKIEDKVVFDTEGIAALTSLNLSEYDLAEATAWFKMHYYYDDAKTKIRYIVCETSDNGYTCVRIFGGSDYTVSNGYRAMYLQNHFIYKALITMPEGYDAVICGHMFADTWLKQVGDFIYNYKHKTIFKWDWKYEYGISITGGGSQRTIDFLTSLCGSATDPKTFDFTEAKNGRILVIGGHFHTDRVLLFKFNSIYSATSNHIIYDYQQYDGTQEISADDFFLIWRNRDAYNGRNNEGSSYRDGSHEMTLNTTTENCFDVVTIKDNGNIVFNRFGPGDDLTLVHP